MIERICERPTPLCERTEQFFRLVADVVKAKDLPETMKILLGGATEILGLQRSCIFNFGDNEEEMVLSHGYPENAHAVGTYFHLSDQKNLKRAIEQDSVFVYKPAENPENEHVFYRNYRINAVLFIRLVLAGETIGVWVLDATEEKYDFSEEEIKIAAAISNLMMNALHYHRELERDTHLKSLGLAQANVAHEVKNPLVSIGGFTKRIKDGLKKLQDEQEQKPEKIKTKINSLLECAQIAHSDLIKLEILVKEVLEFIKPIDPKMERRDLNDAVRPAYKEEKERMEKANSRIEIAFLEEKIPEIMLDEIQIQQVVRQIIQNAVNAIRGGAEKITIKTRAENNFARLEIKNTGSYIPPDDRLAIFTPFFTTRKTEGGSGFGLAMVEKIVKSHGAEITVKSKRNPPETTFIIKFKIPA